jgi:hypothetical protein
MAPNPVLVIRNLIQPPLKHVNIQTTPHAPSNNFERELKLECSSAEVGGAGGNG